MVTLKKKLERLAIKAHQDGWTWLEFWSTNRDAISEAGPYDRRRYHSLLMKLLSLVVGGDDDGCYPLEPLPWEADDQSWHPPGLSGPFLPRRERFPACVSRCSRTK